MNKFFTPMPETAEHFKDLIDELMRMDNIVIEVIGCFVWVTGETKPHKDKLKALKFQWHTKKIAWYLKPEDYRKRCGCRHHPAKHNASCEWALCFAYFQYPRHKFPTTG